MMARYFPKEYNGRSAKNATAEDFVFGTSSRSTVRVKKKESFLMSKTRLATLIGLVSAAALSRLIPHPWNLTPVNAIALFSGAHFSEKRLAFFVPLTAVFLSD